MAGLFPSILFLDRLSNESLPWLEGVVSLFLQRCASYFSSVLLFNLADSARYSSVTDSFSLGHDPITHVRRARFLTDVGDLL